MNFLIKTLAIIWLILSGLTIWIVCAFVGLFLEFTNMAYLSGLTPIIGVTSFTCIIFSIVRIKRSNPIGFMKRVMERLSG